MRKNVTVQQALQYVADHPVIATDELTQVHAYELIARALYEIANTPDSSVRGSMTKANRARRLLLNRLVGKRMMGTAPASHTETKLDFVDLTGKQVEP